MCPRIRAGFKLTHFNSKKRSVARWSHTEKSVEDEELHPQHPTDYVNIIKDVVDLNVV